jgi:penicillin-binding protein 1C
VDSAAPVLLKVFGLLPADKEPAPQVPAGAILAETTDALPPSLRVFTRVTAHENAHATTLPPPAIAYPPNGTVIPLPGPKDADKTILLKADGGKAPLTWLVNGLLIGSYDRFQPALYLPQGVGNARITVVDSEGRSDTSQVRFTREK